MSNPNYQKTSPRPTGGPGSPPSPPGAKSAAPSPMNEKTVNWPGLPGKSGPNRSVGVPKAKVHPKSEGL